MGYIKNLIYQAIVIVVQLRTSLQTCESAETCRSYCYDSYTVRCTGLLNYSEILQERSLEQAREIYIFDSFISDIQPGYFARCNNLEDLRMPGNNISLLEVGAFSGLSNLYNLNLTNNSIQTVSAGLFNGMYKLSVLDLSHNRIRAMDSKAFAGTNGLKTLYLNNNQISTMAALTNHCSNLKFLDLSNNGLKQLQFASSCPKLQDLNVASNILDIFPSEALGETIVSLDLSDNNLSYVKGTDLDKLHALKRLNLSRNRLFDDEDAPVNLFRNQHSLRVLNLSCTSIKKLSVGTFSGMRELTSLDLSSNKLTYLSKGIFHGLRQLNALYLGSNRLSYFDGDVNPVNLYVIGLDDNLWNCDLLSGILKKIQNHVVILGKSYNTTNILGVACYEEIKDFGKVEAYNTSDISDLQKEYLSHIIRTQMDLRETFAQLKAFLNEFSQSENSYSSSAKDILLELEKTLNSTGLSFKDAGNLIGKQKFNLGNAVGNLTDVFRSLQNVTNVIASMENERGTKFLQIKTDNVTAQTMLDIKNILTENLNTVQSNMLRTLVDIRNSIVSTKIETPVSRGDSHSAKAEEFKTSPPVTVNKSDTVVLYLLLYFILTLQLVLLSLLAGWWYYRRYNNFKTIREDSNPLNSI